MTPPIIISIPVLRDNYVHVIFDPNTKACACVDPADDPRVLSAIQGRGWTLSHILITHPHYDHIDGIRALSAAFDCRVYGAKLDTRQIPNCSVGVGDGDTVHVGALVFKVLDLPGHTAHHVGYYVHSADALFAGDTIFSLGCGRINGGTAAQLWQSLKTIRALSSKTALYFSHEYTQDNAKFALSVDGANQDLKIYAKTVDDLRAQGLPTVPSCLADELACNPFLRCADQDAFTKLRLQKDNF